MTRINLVPPSILTDQHLIAEYREISRLPNFLLRSLKSNSKPSIPKAYVFGTGHVSFFYDKMGFIKQRHDSLKLEGAQRGFALDSITMDINHLPSCFCLDYVPDELAIEKSKQRLLEKINLKPAWYKFYRQPISKHFLKEYL